jgi:hypothetical protein
LKRVCSIFSQILQLVPRDRFEAAVVKHQAERHSRGLSSWGQFVAMLFCQLAQAKSLREITEGLQASKGKLKHLGLPEAPARSTLAYANSHRAWQLYETVFHQLLADCRRGSPQEFDNSPVLRGFPESDELSLRHGDSLSFEEQVMQILVSTSSSEQRLGYCH